MDYSLLFVIELNPTYVKYFPNEFEMLYGDDDNLTQVKQSESDLKKTSTKKMQYDNAKKKKEITDEFMQKMAGQDEQYFELKFINLATKKVI